MRLHDLRTILTLRCQGAARLLSDAEDRRLTIAEGIALRGHLLACIWCRRYRAQIRFLHRMAAEWRGRTADTWATHGGRLNDAAKQRMHARIVAEMKRRGGSP